MEYSNKESRKMPVILCPNNMYRIGDGPCVFTSKAAAERAYRAYLAKSHDNTGDSPENKIVTTGSRARRISSEIIE